MKMKMKKGSKITALMLILILFCSIFQPVYAYAEDPGFINAAKQLVKNQEYLSSFNEEKQVHWYKIDSIYEDMEKNSHYRIHFSSEREMNISVYPSLERANSDDTNESYRGYSMLNETSEIDFPLAWTGPYYIKIEYYGAEEDYPEFTEEYDYENSTSADYTLLFEGVKKPPTSGSNGEDCPVELSTAQKKSGKEILSSLRNIRDQFLSQTEKGKELTSLYYKAAPFIVAKMTFHKDIREMVYQDLVTLKPIFNEVIENGSDSSYKLKKQEQESINRLYQLAIDAVPYSLQTEMKKFNEQVNLEKMEELRLSTILDKAEIAPATSKATQNKVIVKLKEGKNISSFKTKTEKFSNKSTTTSFKAKDSLFENMFIMEVENDNQASISSKQMKMTLEQLSILPEVEYVEAVQQYHTLSSDIYYSDQWSLNNSGKDLGQVGADIKFDLLQEVLKEKKIPETLIAVIDTGVDSRLADLENKVRTDLGYNFISHNTNALDDNGHGTHVSGIIAAESNNHFSMTGINHATKIIPIKVLNSSGGGDTETIASGIKYAVDKGANVINLSLGGSYSRVIESALKYAASKGVTIVAASGNEQSSMLSYPASSRYVIAVGATNRSDIVSDYSNYGDGLDLVAPGTGIPSLLPNGNVTYMDGTSMAAPHVAAVAGLLLSQNPKLKPEDVRKTLTETAENIAFEEVDNPENYYYFDDEPIEILPGYDKVSGWGRLNAYSSISAVDLNIKLDPLFDNQNEVTGSAKKNTLVKITNGSKTLGTGTANSNGKLKISIPVQSTNQVLYAEASGGNATTAIRIIVGEGEKPQAPKVNSLSNKDTYVTGTSSPNMTVKVKNADKKVIATGTTDRNGAIKIKISKQKEDTILYVTVTDIGNKESNAVKIKVLDKIAPAAPKVNTISDRDTTIKGETEANATITMKRDGKTIASKKADKKGKFSIKISKQKVGTKLSITATDAAGNISKTTTKTVKDKTAPNAPKVNKVTDRDTSIKGKTEANAAVTIKRNGKIIATNKADKKGAYTIKINKQKAGTVLYITSKDKAGNESKSTKITVQKSK
nr:Ig-like domain-containing protein [Halalkalibacter alkalisediminis]